MRLTHLCGVAAMLLGLILTAAAAAATEAPAPTPIVIGQSHVLASKIMGQDRTLNVYLPADYATSGQAYPVVYLLDGGTDQDFHPVTGLARLGELVDLNRPFIVVGIESVDRRAELAARSSVAGEVKDYPTHGARNAAFRRHLIEEVIPWVAARYRTTPERVVMAESLGGLFVVDTFLNHPDAFTGYIAISPSLWWDDERLSKTAAARLAGPFPTGRRLYLSIGDEGAGMKTGVERLVAALRAHPPAGLRWTYDPLPQETHATIYHPAGFRGLRWMFARPEAAAK